MKKIISNAFNLAAAFALFMVTFGVSANAYIDPSTMFYVFQAGAAIVIGIGAVIAIYWKKAKKKVSKTLNIDENRNKETESDDIIISSDEESE